MDTRLNHPCDIDEANRLTGMLSRLSRITNCTAARVARQLAKQPVDECSANYESNPRVNVRRVAGFPLTQRRSRICAGISLASTDLRVWTRLPNKTSLAAFRVAAERFGECSGFKKTAQTFAPTNFDPSRGVLVGGKRSRDCRRRIKRNYVPARDAA